MNTQTIEDNKIVLTSHQNEVLQAMIDWSFKPFASAEFLTLIGSAGTGKTTIIKEFIERNRFKTYEIAVTAPTHKAKKVIEKATGLRGTTIQKTLGLRPNTNVENFNINRPEFAPMAEPEINKSRLIIVDEASMFNKDLFELTIKKARESKTKIVFVADYAQLPPIGEYISKTCTDIPEIVKLTEIIRQKDTNPITEVLAVLRDDIERRTTNFYKFIRSIPKNINERNEGYETTSDKKKFADNLIIFFKSSNFLFDKEYIKYIAWTNSSVQEINKFIRDNIIETHREVERGDLLMGYNSITDRQETILTNSEEYIVTRVEEFENDFEINGYLVDIDSIDTKFKTTVFVVSKEGLEHFLKIHDEKHSIAIKYKSRWLDYYNFKNKNLLLRDVYEGELKNKKGKKTDKLIVKKDIDFAYGITIHKCQGSTYKNTFVNLSDIGKNIDLEERMKLIYVAISRTVNKCTILINP